MGQFKNEVLHEAFQHKKKKEKNELAELEKLQTRWDRFRDAHNRVRSAYQELEGLRVAIKFDKLGRYEGKLEIMASASTVESTPVPFAYPFLIGIMVAVQIEGVEKHMSVPLVLFCARWDYHERYQANSKKVQYADDHAFWQNLLGGEELCTDAVLNHAMGRVKRDVEVLDLPADYTPVPDDARGLDL